MMPFLKQKHTFFLSILFITFVMSGCASKPGVDSGTASGPHIDLNVPTWASESPGPEIIWGIGIANDPNGAVALITAEERARSSIKEQLDSIAQAVFVDYNKTAEHPSDDAAAKDASSQIDRLPLKEAQTILRWQAPNGTWWYRLEYEKIDAKDTIFEILESETSLQEDLDMTLIGELLNGYIATVSTPVQINQ
jgi:hypothetical protein